MCKWAKIAGRVVADMAEWAIHALFPTANKFFLATQYTVAIIRYNALHAFYGEHHGSMQTMPTIIQTETRMATFLF